MLRTEPLIWIILIILLNVSANINPFLMWERFPHGYDHMDQQASREWVEQVLRQKAQIFFLSDCVRQTICLEELTYYQEEFIRGTSFSFFFKFWSVSSGFVFRSSRRKRGRLALNILRSTAQIWVLLRLSLPQVSPAPQNQSYSAVHTVNSSPSFYFHPLLQLNMWSREI